MIDNAYSVLEWPV